MDWNHIPTFFLMALVVEVSPGPNFLLIIKTVTTAGRVSAIANITGFSTAFMLHGALSIFGVSVILSSSASLFFTVKLLGAAYLCYLGIQVLRELAASKRLLSSTPMYDLPALPPPLGSQSLIRGWREGFITNCLNPKISMFYLAVFPQFIGTASYATADSYFLVMIHIFVNAIWFFLVTIFITRLLQAAKSDKLVHFFKIFSGVALIGFGAFFAVSAAS